MQALLLHQSGLHCATVRIPRKLDTCSAVNWTVIAAQTGHLFHAKLDTLGVTARGGGVVLLRTGRACQICPLFPQRISLQVELMGVVDQAVEDGVGQGGVADGGVPMFNRKLAGDDGRTAAVTVVEHFQQVAPVRVVEHGEPPIVNHEHVYFGQLLEQLHVAAIGAANGQLVKHARQAYVISTATHAASLVRQRAGQQVLPMPVGPVSSTFCFSLSHRPASSR